jgi:putative membrane protein
VSVAEVLAPLNALLNAASATLVVLGFRAIRRGDRTRHQRLMVAAVSVSAAFLASYLTRVALTGKHAFPVGGPLRAAYLAILLSHTVLAALAAPMILRALFLGWKGRYADHRAIARWTFPIWLYVSATGVLVYLLLYQVAPRLID